MQQWEYKILESFSYSSTYALDRLGEEGWELVAVRTNPFNDLSEYAVFKRPKEA